MVENFGELIKYPFYENKTLVNAHSTLLVSKTLVNKTLANPTNSIL